MAEATVIHREYETIFVLKPDIDDNRVVEVATRMRGVVEEAGGKSIKIQNWGKKKLAFEVQKVQKGIYLHHKFVGQPSLIKEYERVLKYLDDAILYQTIRVADQVDIDARVAEEDVLVAPARDARRERTSPRHSGRDRGDGRRDGYEHRSRGDSGAADLDDDDGDISASDDDGADTDNSVEED